MKALGSGELPRVRTRQIRVKWLPSRSKEAKRRLSVDVDLALGTVGLEVTLVVNALQGLGQALGLKLHPLGMWRTVRVDV